MLYVNGLNKKIDKYCSSFDSSSLYFSFSLAYEPNNKIKSQKQHHHETKQNYSKNRRIVKTSTANRKKRNGKYVLNNGTDGLFVQIEHTRKHMTFSKINPKQKTG